SGVLQRIVVPAGTELSEVGCLLAVIAEEEMQTVSEPTVDEPSSEPTLAIRSDERVSVTPLARRMAIVAGVDLGEIRGSGPGGVGRAAALALGKVRQANSAWAEAAGRVYDSAHIAVAVNTQAGLITPVIRSAETKGLAAISRELKGLTDRARAGQLRPEEYAG